MDVRFLYGRLELLRELVEPGAPIPDHPDLIVSLSAVEFSGATLVACLDLAELAKRLESNTSPQTQLYWESTLKQLIISLKHDNLHILTREDAASYRDDILKRHKVSMVKTRLDSISGLLNLAAEEELLILNPFKGVSKRPQTPERVMQEIPNVKEVDGLVKTRLPVQHYVFYRVLQYSGMRLA
ncbi:MAG: hypothetical protein NTZ53_09005 [Cyanobacteria bacterium]|nr:hypothetical protein [Cyanobacteriota bacterium]